MASQRSKKKIWKNIKKYDNFRSEKELLVLCMEMAIAEQCCVLCFVVAISNN